MSEDDSRAEIEALIKKFVSECHEKNYSGIAAVMPSDERKSQIGISANYLDAVYLLRTTLYKLQEVTGISSILLATHLALAIAILDIDATRQEPIEKIDSALLEKASNIVRSYIDIQLAKTRLEEARNSNYNPILH